MCIPCLERFFWGKGVEVIPDAESRTTDHAEAGWDITSPVAEDEAVTMAAHEAASCKTIRNAMHYPT